MIPFFVATMFLSATLLFWIQPLFTKMVLPYLGGSPAVWNTAIMFFQAMLLAGYAYTHISARLLGVKRQAVLHLVVLAVALLMLPVSAVGLAPPSSETPIVWLIYALTVSLGLPFFALSATAPMLQMWVAHTRHPAAANPYFLYGASNLGSILALLAYPVLAEPLFRLSEQSWIWSGGFALLLLLIFGCTALMWRDYVAPPAPAAPAKDNKTITNRRRLHWVLLAFAPSSLLLGVTTHISTNIAAVPLLWVIPLVLYLLTFVIVFARRPLFSHRAMVQLLPVVVILLMITLFLGIGVDLVVLYPLHLLTFFVLALVCHGELAARRPAASLLTEFYLWMSVGGLLGGIFNVLIAPILFQNVLEYPLAIAAACALRPNLSGTERRLFVRDDLLWPLALAAVLAVLVFFFGDQLSRFGRWGWVVVSLYLAMTLYSFNRRPLRFGLGVAVALLLGYGCCQSNNNVMLAERNFFGIVRVIEGTNPPRFSLIHGTTLHGTQALNPAKRLRPTSHFEPTGPLGDIVKAFPEHLAGGEMAMLGLGIGSAVCYSGPDQRVVLYEINPAVVRIARDQRYFTFLKACAPRAEIILGDARLKLREAANERYRFIVLDAFSTSSIPMHLLTREALALFLSKLEPGGLLVFHISNKHLNLNPVLGNLVADLGLVALIRRDAEVSQAAYIENLKQPSEWVVIARKLHELAPLAKDKRWSPLSTDPKVGVWSDDYSNLWSTFIPFR